MHYRSSVGILDVDAIVKDLQWWSILHYFCNFYLLGLAGYWNDFGSTLACGNMMHGGRYFFWIIWFELTAKLYVTSLWIDILSKVHRASLLSIQCNAIMRQRKKKKNIISHVNKETAIVAVKKTDDNEQPMLKRFTSVFLVPRFICEGNRS